MALGRRETRVRDSSKNARVPAIVGYRIDVARGRFHKISRDYILFVDFGVDPSTLIRWYRDILNYIGGLIPRLPMLELGVQDVIYPSKR